LGERLLCKQEVIGSIPFTSTSSDLSRLEHQRETLRWWSIEGSAELALPNFVRRDPGAGAVMPHGCLSS
jgi:hypothetical protein